MADGAASAVQGKYVFNYLRVLPECISHEKRQSSSNSVANCCATVYRGSFIDNDRVIHSVAVKKYLNSESSRTIMSESITHKAVENLKFLSLPGNKHPNFIRFFKDDTKRKFKYLITELCICSVGDLVSYKRVKTYTTYHQDLIKEGQLFAQDILKVLPHKEILKQSAEAVNFLHGLGLIHRNLHPNNFLIQRTSNANSSFTVKLTDFQLTKDWEKNAELSKSFSWSDWIVPEQAGSFTSDEDKRKVDEDPKTDVFTLGCYFYYVLTGGKHPFGDYFAERRRNIRDGEHSVYKSDDSSAWNLLDKLVTVSDENEQKAVIKLMQSMIRFIPSQRKSMWQVLQDEYFYPNYRPYYNIYDNASKILPEKPGLCVIICQETFEKGWDPLKGINNDASQLMRTFARFGYDVLRYNNLKSDQMIKHLTPDQLANQLGQENLNRYASLVICILSHGNKGIVYGVDCLPVSINHLRDMFSSGNCPAMAGKPKIFIIFACQGSNDQMVETTSPNECPNDEEMTPAVVVNHPGVTAVEEQLNGSPPVADFLFLISSIEDFISYYLSDVGSPFISYLCGAMMSEYGNNSAQSAEEEKDKRDLVNLFTSAVAPQLGRWVIKRDGTPDGITCRQTPELRSSLTKTIRFRAKQSTFAIANQIKEDADFLAQYNRDPSAPVQFICSML